ncbi:CpsD/CapB family tyrosine-protein kinase [Periweissella fabaria]|uniref:Tyrosine-protein kinase CpsD n=1 Tax=Periweissella fabaria TaxID=546157 RepID=A0ABN8BFK2_9LACO|nr:CpsD/CapB family tyrosine-protein kinase [Periweissella fabaria]MCM0596588.1 CpsD/CapB family tyrosine-protein kinase [Periweissella fabaria]CAH0416487.1 Putative tyrosine-protein kinase YveL [Periweissella fabaria]
MNLFNKRKKLKKVDKYTQKFGTRLVNFVDSKSVAAEQVRMIKTNIEFASVAREKMKSIIVTSPEMSDGKSMVSANLATAWAQSGKKVLFIDVDLRRPTLHATFDFENIQGLTNFLSGQTSLENVIKETAIDNLSVITSGPIPPNPVELLGSKKMADFLNAVEDMYDIVILDTPPVTLVADTQILATKVDGVVIVVKYGKTTKLALKRTVELIKHVEGSILGIVTRTEPKESVGYGYGYGYGDIK